MAPRRETYHHIKESIESSLGLPISTESMRSKLTASEDARRRLQNQICALEDRLREDTKRLEFYRAEARMNANGLKRCVEEKEAMASRCNDLETHCAEMERECLLYEQDVKRVMESYDELAKENDELRARLQDNLHLMALASEVESLQKDKEILLVNLHRAEEEVVVLFEENKFLDEENKRLLLLLKRKRHHISSDSKHSNSASVKGKRKASLRDNSLTSGATDFSDASSSRESHCHRNLQCCTSEYSLL